MFHGVEQHSYCCTEEQLSNSETEELQLNYVADSMRMERKCRSDVESLKMRIDSQSNRKRITGMRIWRYKEKSKCRKHLNK